MKILKYIVFIILGIIALALILALFTPKTFHAEGNTTVNKPVTEVYDYVRMIKNQEDFGVWFAMDDQMIKESIGTDGTVGFRYTWKSEKVGDGEQVITKLDPNNRVDIDIFFNGETDAAKTFFVTEAIDSTNTKVKWAIDGEIPYPFNLMNLFMDMNKDFQAGVDQLKINLENQ